MEEKERGGGEGEGGGEEEEGGGGLIGCVVNKKMHKLYSFSDRDWCDAEVIGVMQKNEAQKNRGRKRRQF